MEELLNAPIDEIVMIFNDELNNMINQLMSIAKQITITSDENTLILASKNKLLNAIKINEFLCIELYAKFLLKDEFEDFFDNIKNRKYDYFFELADRADIDEEFRDIIFLVKTISYKVGNETREDIFGYMENLSFLATIFAQKKLTK